MLTVQIRHPLGKRFALDLEIASATPRLGVFGASGSGKSSLLACIAGVTRPATGRIQCGDTVWQDSRTGAQIPLARRRVGFMTQDPLLFPHYTVEQNLRYSPTAHSTGGRFDAVVDALGLQPLLTRMPRSLSGGEQSRVALGRALLSDPALLLLDEPFAGLDAASRRTATALLDRVHGQFGVPWVVVSHDGADLVTLADEVVVLEAGRVVAQGEPLACMATHTANPLALAHGIDNLLRGTARPVTGEPELATFTWADHHLTAPAPAAWTTESTYGCFANGIMLSLTEPVRQSARNHLRARVAAVHPIGAEAVVDLAVGAGRLRGLVLERTLADLGLTVGATVWANIKTTGLAPLS